MQITINIRYTGKNGSVKFFLQELMESGTINEIRAEQGNLRYEYFWSLDDPETVLLIDSWENREALYAHQSSQMAATISQLREKYDITMIVERYIRAEEVVK